MVYNCVSLNVFIRKLTKFKITTTVVVATVVVAALVVVAAVVYTAVAVTIGTHFIISISTILLL